MASSPNYELDRTEYYLALTEYQLIHKSCFLPVTESQPVWYTDPIRKRNAQFIYEVQLNSKSIASIKAGVRRKDISAMREYGIRLQTGLHVPKDSPAAVRIFLSIAMGPYPRSERAIAYSLAAHSCKMQILSNKEGVRGRGVTVLTPGIYAERSIELGLFSFACFCMAQLYDGLGARLRSPFNQLEALWSSYEDYRRLTGLQRPRSRTCAKCDYRPRHKSSLSRCGGHCVYPNKPVYCNRTCQTADWEYHKQFCKRPSSDQEDSEKESASEEIYERFPSRNMFVDSNSESPR